MPADAEATLPALIEAVKSAIPNDRKAAIEKRGEAAKKARPKRASATSRPRRSPGTRARSAPRASSWRLWGADQGPRLVARRVSPATSATGRTGCGRWRSTTTGSARRAATASATALPASVGAALANRDLGRFSVIDPGRRRPDVRAGRAVDRGAAQDSAAVGDAQQPRLSPGGDARAAAVELPQSRGQPRQRHRADRHQHHESGHRVPQARGIDGLVGEGSDQGPGRARRRRSRRRWRW